MNEFKLKKHGVIKAYFSGETELEKKTGYEMGVEGNLLIPKEEIENGQVIVTLNFHLGSDSDNMKMMLDTVTVFELVSPKEGGFEEEMVRRKCLPQALEKLRMTVKQVSEAYGLTSLILPPFEE